jgi:hypothetical protein
MLTEENQSTGRETCRSATLSNINSTWARLGTNPGPPQSETWQGQCRQWIFGLQRTKRFLSELNDPHLLKKGFYYVTFLISYVFTLHVST